MACGGGYTFEDEHFYKMYKLAVEITPKSLRRLLVTNAPNGDVKTFLTQNHAIISRLQRQGILRHDQLQLINPPQGQVFDLNNWDVTLLCAVVKNVCQIRTITVKTAIDCIKTERNNLSHCSTTKLTSAEFNARWTALEGNVNVVTSSLNDPAFQRFISDECSQLKKSQVSSQDLHVLFTAHIQADISVKESLHELKQFFIVKSQESNNLAKELKQEFANIADVTTRNLKQNTDASVEIGRNVKDIKLVVCNSTRAQTSAEQSPQLPRGKPKKTLHQRVELLSSQTETILRSESNYVETDLFKEAQKKLMENNCVVIRGGTGEGKTSTAFELMRRSKQQKPSIQIHVSDDIHKIEPNVFEFVFIDDIFGNYELDENKLQSWSVVLEKIQNLVNSKAFKLIIATSEIAFRESYDLLEKYSVFKSSVLLETDKLKEEEKENILQRTLITKKRVLSQDEIKKCVACQKSGFPYVCFLFASDDSFFEEKESFFLRKEIMDPGQFNKAKQLSLLFLWIKEGKIKDISEEGFTLLKDIAKRLEYKAGGDTLRDEVKQNLDAMSGTFIRKQGNVYTFAHNSIYRKVGLFFARKKNLYDIVIRHCNLDFFMECIRIDDQSGNEDYNVPRASFQHVVDRITNEVIQNKRCRAMAVHPCLKNEIVDLLFENLKRSKHLKEFFMSEKCTSTTDYINEDDDDGSFLFHLMESNSSISITILKRVIELLKCSHLFRRSVNCKRCTIFKNAIKGACRGGNIDAVKLLTFVAVDRSVVIDSLFGNNKDIYQIVSLKLPGYEENDEVKLQCMQVSVIQGHTEIFNQIVRDGMKPDIYCLRLAVDNQRFDFVKLILQNIPRLVDKKEISKILRNLDDYETLETFVNFGFLPTTEDLKHLINMFGERLKPMLHDFKFPFHNRAGQFKAEKRELWIRISCDSELGKMMSEFGL